MDPPGFGSFAERQLIKRRGRSKHKCFQQLYTQVVGGRGLSYKRALRIIQDEEYLTATDKSIIKRIKRKSPGEQARRLFKCANEE